MSTYLLVATPLYGHVSPVVTVGRALAGRGHQVTVLTGAAYRPLVRSSGLAFRPLPPAADTGHRPRGRWDAVRPRWAAGVRDVIDLFVAPLAAQYGAVLAELEAVGYDAVVADTAFLGVQPLLLREPAAQRLPVIGLSATPISLVSADSAPFGSALRPGPGLEARNRRIYWLLDHGPLRPLHRALDAALAPFGVPAGRLNYFDQIATFDRTFHLGLPELEYPRRELPASVEMVGPLPPAHEPGPPPWWPDLRAARRVVHITQGTLDNTDLGRLLIPAIRGLAGEEVLVVVSTGRRPAAALLGALGRRSPDNVRIAEFLPYRRLLPLVDVMVTNGGYGGVQQAVRHGVPLVVAGATEDKPEVANRVAWAGVGLDLRTGRPTPGQVRRAVTRVLSDSRFADRAATVRGLAEGRPDPLRRIVAGVEASPIRSNTYSFSPGPGPGV